MNYRFWAELFAVFLMAETTALGIVIDKNDQLKIAVAQKSPAEEHCAAALDQCNKINETKTGP